MIYIDPPYNTGKDFVYPDNYADPIGSYLEMTGQADGEGKLSTNSETSGRFHSEWLNMMYPRLKLARNLLTEDGVLFVSIGDSELHNLVSTLNEVFGEDNALPIVSRITKRSSNNGNSFSPCIDYIVSYSRNVSAIRRFSVPLTDEQKASYNKIDSKGAYKEIGLYQAALKHGGSRYPIETPDGSFVITPGESPWRWSQERYEFGLSNDEIVFKKTATSPLIDAHTGSQSEWNLYTKLYLAEREAEGLLPKNFFDNFQNNLGARELKNLGIPFDFPKTTELIKYLASGMGISGFDIILDFFAGSGTTAHAVMQLNAEDGGNRRCISVQLPEPTPESSEAFKAGYKTISEITRERIRRAGDKIRADFGFALDARETPLDTGFRAYKLVDTNFAKWSLKSDTTPEALLDSFNQIIDSADGKATPDELLTEVLLKLGFSLTETIENLEIDGLQVQSVNDGLVLAYLNEKQKPTLEQLRSLVALHPTQLVLLEDVLKGDDELKTNLVQECRTHDIKLWTV